MAQTMAINYKELSQEQRDELNKNITSRCDIKESDGTMLNPIFWKKVHWDENVIKFCIQKL